MRTLVPLLAVPTLLVALASPARATPNFPAVVRSDLSLSYTPDCSLCHTDGDTGGLGTANTPFGISVRAFGTVAYDTTALTKALNDIAADPECMEDVTELAAHQTPTVTCGSAEGPTYGCSTANASGSASDAPWLSAIGVAATLVAVGRRRRRPRRRS